MKINHSLRYKNNIRNNSLRLPITVNFIFIVACCLFIIQPWSIHIANIPLQVALVWICLMIVIAIHFQKFIQISLSFSIFQWCCILIILFSILHRVVVDEVSFLRIQQILTGLTISFIASLVIVDRKSRNLLIYSMLLMASISASVAILQYLGKADWSWQGTLYHSFSHKTPSGLAVYPVAYSNSVLGISIASGIIALYQLYNLKQHKLSFRWPFLMLAASILITLGIVVSGSRSGLLGIFCAAITIWILFRFVNIKFFPFSLMICFIATILCIYFFFEWSLIEVFKEKMKKVDSDTRLFDSWRLFLPVIIDYPWGIPAEIYEKREISTGNLGSAYRGFNGYDPHNFILTFSLFFGILAGIAQLFFYSSLVFHGVSALKKYTYSSTKEDVILLLIFTGVIVSLIVHFWFHNASIFLGEMRCWLWVGFLQGLIYKMKNDNLAKKTLL